MGWISKSWTQEIADVTDTSDFHNAVISILDPSLVTTTWDIDANVPQAVGNPVVASGVPARINWPLRSINDPGTTDRDQSVIRAGRCQFNYADYSGPLRTGMRIQITDGGGNPDLTRYLFTIEEALDGSWMASRTCKIVVDAQTAGT